MAIGADDRIRKYGTRTGLDGSTANVASGAYTTSGQITTWSNDDDAEEAVLDLHLTFNTNPTAGELVLLYMRKKAIDGTNAENEPSDNNQMAYVGSVSVDATTSTQRFQVEIHLNSNATGQDYDFYMKNDTSVQLNSGWTADITPIAPGPHA